jgi:hypothetical protein
MWWEKIPILLHLKHKMTDYIQVSEVWGSEGCDYEDNCILWWDV